MSVTSTQGSRPPSAPVLPASAQAGNGRAAGVQTAPASGRLAAALPTVDPVSLQNDIVSLSKQGLQARSASELGNKTIDFAQSLIGNFAKRLIGIAAKDATISFDSASIEAESRFSGAISQAVTPQGSISKASFQLSESSSFVGTGQITTEDGQTFDFEIEVRYEARVDASISQYTETAAREPGLSLPDELSLTGKPLPAIEFPGSLSDLFKLLGRELSGSIGEEGNGEGGDLTMRLLRLVDRAALLAPRARPDDPQTPPAERARALANAYASAPASSELSSA